METSPYGLHDEFELASLGRGEQYEGHPGRGPHSETIECAAETARLDKAIRGNRKPAGLMKEAVRCEFGISPKTLGKWERGLAFPISRCSARPRSDLTPDTGERAADCTPGILVCAYRLQRCQQARLVAPAFMESRRCRDLGPRCSSTARSRGRRQP